MTYLLDHSTFKALNILCSWICKEFCQNMFFPPLLWGLLVDSLLKPRLIFKALSSLSEEVSFPMADSGQVIQHSNNSSSIN